MAVTIKKKKKEPIIKLTMGGGKTEPVVDKHLVDFNQKEDIPKFAQSAPGLDEDIPIGKKHIPKKTSIWEDMPYVDAKEAEDDQDPMLGEISYDTTKQHLVITTPNGTDVLPLDDASYSLGGVYKDGQVLTVSDGSGQLEWVDGTSPKTHQCEGEDNLPAMDGVAKLEGLVYYCPTMGATAVNGSKTTYYIKPNLTPSPMLEIEIHCECGAYHTFQLAEFF